ncbi:hypothetical protein [Ammoniphilus sp. YIM 78166]|uniref:hypothetical protein n=1 Tax=Ammoniphilus sp. YIM 78166 TaxID=1644106 RepID=UPI0014308F2E|nr:hypothetical protein [Ammoniphilus sp. YIM 78166]
MGLFQKKQRTKEENQDYSNGECVHCSGKGFYQYGLEFVHIHECPGCDGSGRTMGE